MKTLLRNFIAQEKCPPEMLKGGSGGQSGLYNVTAAVACEYCLLLLSLAIANNVCIMMYKYSQRQEYVEPYKPKMELRAKPKVKMKVSLTKKERGLQSPYYVANRLWYQLDHTVQNINSVYDFSIAVKKVGFSQFKDIVKYA